MDDRPDVRFPPVSRPAGDFGEAASSRRPAAPWEALDLAGVDRLEIVCPRPVHHVLEFAGLYRLIEGVRRARPEVRLRLWYRSALAAEAPFRRLPVDALERLPARDEGGALAAALARPGSPGAAVILVAGDAAWRARLEEPGVSRPVDRGPVDTRPLAEIPLDFRLPWPESPASQAASDRFYADLSASSGSWRVQASPAPPPPADRPLELLIHQARFHVGDTLWLTPLLRVIRRRLPAARITVAGSPVLERVLARSPHVDELLVYDPGGGEIERSRVRHALGGRRYDAALFAFARRDKSRWLAELAAELAIPRRVNLEYFEAADDGLRDPEPFTHEGRFFWNTLASPRMLLYALAPLLSATPAAGDWLADRRVEFAPSRDERRLAAELLDADGIGDAPFAVLAPGGSSSQRWPAERFAALALRLRAEGGLHVVLEGGPDDESLFRELAALLGQRPAGGGRGGGVILRRDPLGVLAALLERAALLVSNDSAPIHFAEVSGTPTLYFAHQEKLTHSHPARASHWALFDGQANRPANVTVDQAAAAARACMTRPAP